MGTADFIRHASGGLIWRSAMRFAAPLGVLLVANARGGCTLHNAGTSHYRSRRNRKLGATNGVSICCVVISGSAGDGGWPSGTRSWRNRGGIGRAGTTGLDGARVPVNYLLIAHYHLMLPTAFLHFYIPSLNLPAQSLPHLMKG
jgi:hypothetical protein